MNPARYREVIERLTAERDRYRAALHEIAEVHPGDTNAAEIAAHIARLALQGP